MIRLNMQAFVRSLLLRDSFRLVQTRSDMQTPTIFRTKDAFVRLQRLVSRFQMGRR